MNDYEINRRLAEIAGVDVLQKYYEDGDGPFLLTIADFDVWNPLHNWSQLGPLMERFRVQVEPGWLRYPDGAECWGAIVVCEDGTSADGEDPDLKRAIALAIIAAFEEE